jgi:serine/threonine-protein phosphatase PGAM5
MRSPQPRPRRLSAALTAAVLLLVAAALLFPPESGSAERGAARTIILVRHGDYVADRDDWSPGPGLSPLGVAQAKLAAARLAAMPGTFDAIYASPLTRADETAKIIAAALPGTPFETLDDLAECTPPTRRRDVMERKKPEKMAACASKLKRLFRQRFVPARGAPRNEIFVCHGNVTRYFVTRALGVDTKAWLEMSIGHASLTEIRIEPDGSFRVISVGDVGHIPPNLQTGSTGRSRKALDAPQ